MADSIKSKKEDDSAAEAKMTSSGADFVASGHGVRNTDVSGKTVPPIDGIEGAGLVTTSSTTADDFPFGDTDTLATTTPEPAATVPTPAPASPVSEIKDQAVQKGQAAVEQGKQVASQALEQGKQAASQALEQGKEAAGQALDQAREQIVTQLDTRKDTLATTLEGAVQALHSTSQQFRDQNIPYVGEYAETFASQVEKASDYLRGKDVTELARDAEKFARANPIAFVSGAFVLGIALARFLKSSAEGSPLAFAQTGSDASATTALVPYSGGADVTSTTSTTSGSATDQSAKVQDAFGERPLSAHGYVAGVGSIGDNA